LALITIDRFEGDWALLEWDGRSFSFPRVLLPERAGEGDVLQFSCSVDRGKTAARRRRVKKLEEELFRGG